MDIVYRILNDVTPNGKDVYGDWLRKLRDTKAKIAAQRRLNRVTQRNFGDHKHCREGVWELGIDVGAGYRIYYGLLGTEVVILLCGGDKSSQSADIDRAVAYWKSAQKEIA